MTYIGNWAFVVVIITFKFLLDSHPFLFEMIGTNN